MINVTVNILILGKLLCKRFKHAQALKKESDEELKKLMQLSPSQLTCFDCIGLLLDLNLYLDIRSSVCCF